MVTEHDINRMAINETLNSRITSSGYSKRTDVYIENYAWIGRKVMILKGVSISDCVII